MYRVARATLDRPALTLAVVAVMTLLLGACAAFGLRIDNSIDAWLPSGDESLARYERFRETFGEDTFCIVAFDGVDATDPATRAGVASLAAALAEIAGVERVVGPSDDPAQKRATAHLTSADGTSVALLVYTTALHGADAAVRHLAIEDAASVSELGTATFIAGPEAVNHALDTGSQEAFSLLFPIVVIVVALSLWIALRAIWPVIGILLVSAVSSTWVLGATALAGRPLNMVLSTLPSLMVVLGTAYSLHVTNAFRRDSSDGIRQRWAAAVSDTLHPCLITAATTAAGFLALAIADLLPVRDLGLFAGLGTLFSVALVFTFLPAFLGLVWRPDAVAARSADRTTANWSPARAIHRARFAILGVALIATGIAAAGTARLRVESHILSFFPDDDPVVQATRHIEDRLLGLTALDVWMHGPAASVLSAETMTALQDLAAAADTESDVTDILGPVVSDNALLALPPEQLVAAMRGALPDQTAAAGTGARMRMIDDELHLRVTAAALTTSIETSEGLLQRLEALLERDLPDGVTAEITGAVPILVRVQAMLLRTQIETFSVSMFVVTALLVVAFRSAKLALLSLVPNVLPILLTLGTMGWLGVPLDVATVTVASVAMGLVVDDTIHLLERYARTAREGMTQIARIDEVFRTTGRPVLFTSLATAAGFAAFAFSDFQPVFYFGTLIALTAVYALLADLLVLPALLMVRA